MNREFWNERYGAAEYIYGTEPNVFFRQQLELLPPGRLLLPAEGEGRNAVFAAAAGWEVDAFDQSEAGQHKARQLAGQRGVQIRYRILDIRDMDYPAGAFGAVGLIYAHMPAALRAAFHLRIQELLAPGGLLILEGFSKDQLQFQSGGPKDPAMLFSPEELQAEFSGMEILMLNQLHIELQEGAYHAGTASVVRMLARRG